MFCEHCGELAPPGPLDVRGCAPRPKSGSNFVKLISAGLRSRLIDLSRMPREWASSRKRLVILRNHCARADYEHSGNANALETRDK